MNQRIRAEIDRLCIRVRRLHDEVDLEKDRSSGERFLQASRLELALAMAAKELERARGVAQ